MSPQERIYFIDDLLQAKGRDDIFALVCRIARATEGNVYLVTRESTIMIAENDSFYQNYPPRGAYRTQAVRSHSAGKYTQ
jgi:hypothetical protein